MASAAAADPARADPARDADAASDQQALLRPEAPARQSRLAWRLAAVGAVAAVLVLGVAAAAAAAPAAGRGPSGCAGDSCKVGPSRGLDATLQLKLMKQERTDVSKTKTSPKASTTSTRATNKTRTTNKTSTTNKGFDEEVLAYADNYCPVSGYNCTSTKCCAEPGFQCYKKRSDWASCRQNCTKGESLPGDPDTAPWDCEALGNRTPEPDNEDWSKCAKRGADCRSQKCCSGMDDHCYLQNEEWGTCMQECDPSAAATKHWSCKKVF